MRLGQQMPISIRRKISRTKIRNYATGKKKKLFGPDNPAYGRTCNKPYVGYSKELGHGYRSKWELAYCTMLKCMGIEYVYEPDRFDVGDGLTYTPDVYIIPSDSYIEVKGYMDDKARIRIGNFMKMYPEKQLGLVQRKEMAIVKEFLNVIGDKIKFRV